jgi:hypothetical protein
LSFPLYPVAHAAHARFESGNRTIKGRHTAVDQLITFNGFGNTLSNLGGGALLEMIMEILTSMGNLPRTGCVTVSETWKKKFSKSIGIIIINATEILP